MIDQATFHYFRQRLSQTAIVFLACELLTRGYLLAVAGVEHLSVIEFFKIFAIGFVFDLTVLSFFLIPVCLYLTFLKEKKHGSGLDRKISFIFFALFAFVMIFTSIAETFFWEEFSARFNFIAVDYLVYTTEVLRNIKESYSLGIVFSIIFVILTAVLLLSLYFSRKTHLLPVPPFKKRAGMSLLMVVFSIALYFSTPQTILSTLHSQIHREIAQNGIFSLFSAFFQNSLAYDQFYLTEKDLKARGIDAYAPSEKAETLHETKENRQKYNVILVLMESMSAEFMATFGNKENLTPHLDKLSKESLFFTNLYATGTRTVRGIEALILAIPPSPGQSIVKRPHNENLKSMGFIFKKHGYQTRFIYGGNAYFDNMEHFFFHNGFEIVQHKDFEQDEIHFENAWGICDEDLFDKVILEADKSYHAGTPFMTFALTTSNHRPYTYPEGKIDLAPKVTGRAGGVKYADYAIGQLIEKAKTKPWFDRTLFVFIADHTHGTSGRLEITPEKHHIPCIIYAPKILKPMKISTMISQIDIPAILFGLLGIHFESDFAVDILKASKNPSFKGRAFISNFQKLGYLEGDHLTILKPVKEVVSYQGAIPTKDLSDLSKAVYFFSRASDWQRTLR